MNEWKPVLTVPAFVKLWTRSFSADLSADRLRRTRRPRKGPLFRVSDRMFFERWWGKAREFPLEIHLVQNSLLIAFIVTLVSVAWPFLVRWPLPLRLEGALKCSRR